MNYDKLMIETAINVSSYSTCGRVKVGAVLALDDRIIASGYNGVASGLVHCTTVFPKEIRKGEEFSKTHHQFSTNNEIHAEQNLISFCAKNGIKTDGATIYITHSPCIHCAKLIIASGIKRVVYNELYDRDQNFMVLFDRLKIMYGLHK